ncbi:MAG: hypothetical protein ACI3X9_03375, partial [Bacteroidaceae bacterium]
MTRSLEGCCSNPTELPNHPLAAALLGEKLHKSGAKLRFSRHLYKEWGEFFLYSPHIVCFC